MIFQRGVTKTLFIKHSLQFRKSFIFYEIIQSTCKCIKAVCQIISIDILLLFKRNILNTGKRYRRIRLGFAEFVSYIVWDK